MCWLKWKHAVISLCINLVSCEQSCMLPLTWWVPLGNWHFSGCLKHGCASRQALPFGTSVLEVRQRTGTHLLIIKITYSVCFAMPRTHLFPWDKTYQKVTIFKCETRADDGRCFLQRPQASPLWLWGYTQKREGSEAIVWQKSMSLHQSLVNLKRIRVILNRKEYPLTVFLHPREMLENPRPKLENSAPFLLS